MNSIGETTNFCRLNVGLQQKGKPPLTAPKPTTPLFTAPKTVSPPLFFQHFQPPIFTSDPLANLVLNENERAIFEVNVLFLSFLFLRFFIFVFFGF